MIMAYHERQKPKRIPIRFIDEEGANGMNAKDSKDESSRPGAGGAEPSPEEIGRASSYEDETEVKRRIDRGTEEDDEGGRERADETDAAGGPAPSDLPERREDQDEAGAQSEAQNDATKAVNQPVAPQNAASGPMVAELIATRAELKRIEAERAELMDKIARRQADFENYRKRIERERGEAYARVVAEVASKLLPVLDNLRRALDAESSVKAGESEEFRHFLNGIELIYNQLNGVLQELGVEPVAAVGQPFDPHVHEAVITERTEDFEPDTVMQELVRGYRIGEKLLRPAVVKVATK
jgi:molecular chaperone GrpE